MTATKPKHRVYAIAFGEVYPHYLAKAEKHGRTKRELDQIIRWLTGYSQRQVMAHVRKGTDFETFFGNAPELHPNRTQITGVVCAVRVEEVEEPLMREIRYLDKLVLELSTGKAMEKILRTPPT